MRAAAILLVATMFMLVKYVAQLGAAVPEIMFWRQAVSLPLILVWLWASGGLGKLRTSRIGSHGRRAMLGMGAMGLNFLALSYLPLAEATTLSFTAPLFAVVLAALVWHEKIGPWRWSAVLLGFLGVVFIANPRAGELLQLGTAAGIAGGFVVAIVSFQIRDLALTEAPLACVFWFAVFGALLMGALLPFYMTPHDGEVWLLLLAVGVVGTLGQLLATISLKYGAVASVVVIDYTSLVWSTFYGWLLWDRLPGSSTWVGALAIVAAGIIIAWRAHRYARRAVPAGGLEGD